MKENIDEIKDFQTKRGLLTDEEMEVKGLREMF